MTSKTDASAPSPTAPVQETSHTRHPGYFTTRAWGLFEYLNKKGEPPIRFTKEGKEGRSGPLGYVFGRGVDCDVLLPPSAFTSSRHFLIYKEVELASECVFLRDLSTNGTYVNGARVGTGNTARLEHGDHIVIFHAFTFIKGEPDNDLSFDSQFELGERLGSGNFAAVYQAIDKKSGVAYAVKVVKKNSSLNTKLALSREREIGTLMSIDHPNLLRLYKVFHEETRYYMVTELARGGELFNHVKTRKFTESRARYVFRQLLEGVKYLHDRGIVHRDLKLENILVMDVNNMTIKISDFGLANILGESSFLDTICGTPSYVAPEVIRRQRYGKEVDMWSLGVVLYIFLCGFPPFSEDLGPPRLRLQVLDNLYTFPSPYWDDVSEEAVDLVQMLLRQNIEERYTVDDALAHVWMKLKDGQGTMPVDARAAPKPEVKALARRLITEHHDRRIARNYSNVSDHTQSRGSLSSIVESSRSHESLLALGSSKLIEDDGSERAETASTLSQNEHEADVSVHRAVVEISSDSSNDDDKGGSGNNGDNGENNADVVRGQETQRIMRSKSRTWADSQETLVGTHAENAIDLTHTPPKRRRKS
ncbi:hypothetical protein BGZ58_009834 [Dissophora ornata]|nr:hypothetical protein BGZ58_009834 [Dissophora ornata]